MVCVNLNCTLGQCIMKYYTYVQHMCMHACVYLYTDIKHKLHACTQFNCINLMYIGILYRFPSSPYNCVGFRVGTFPKLSPQLPVCDHRPSISSTCMIFDDRLGVQSAIKSNPADSV